MNSVEKAVYFLPALAPALQRNSLKGKQAMKKPPLQYQLRREESRQRLIDILELYQRESLDPERDRVPDTIRREYGSPAVIRAVLGLMTEQERVERLRVREQGRIRKQALDCRTKAALVRLREKIEREKRTARRRARHTAALPQVLRALQDRAIEEALASKSAAMCNAGKILKMQGKQKDNRGNR